MGLLKNFWPRSQTERVRCIIVLLAGMLAAEKAELSREIPSSLFLVVFAEMLALQPFPVVLRDYTLVTLGG